MSDTVKTLLFALAVCLCCSLALASAYAVLNPIYVENKKNELRALVLRACGESSKEYSNEELKQRFEDKVSFVVLDSKGQLIEGKQDVFKLKESEQFKEKNGVKDCYPIFIYTADDNSKRYVVQMSGKGLWSTIKSLVALEPDFATISGFEVTGQQETPGLGGEIEKDYFRERFKGKKLFENGIVLKFEVVKPGAQTNHHKVDGLSGATMTCNGVTKLINKDFAVYNSYFKTRRAEGGK